MGRLRCTLVSALVLLCAVSPTLAWGQSTVDLPGNRVVPDANGVDILSGTYTTASPFHFNAPAASRLNFRTAFNGYKLSFPLNIYLDDDTYTDVPEPPSIAFTLNAGGEPKVFYCGRGAASGRCTPHSNNAENPQTDIDGSYLEANGAYKLLYVDRDGVKYYFDNALTALGTGCRDDITVCYYTKYYYSVGSIVYPNGEKLTFLPYSEKITRNGRTYFRATVTSNLGYSLYFLLDQTAYPNSSPSTVAGANWNGIARNGDAAKAIIELYKGSVKIAAISSSVNNVFSGLGLVSSDLQQIDDLGRQYKVSSTIHAVTWCSGDLNQGCSIPVDNTQLVPVKVVGPSGMTRDITYAEYPINGVKHVKTVSDGQNVWEYNYARTSHNIKDPLGHSKTYSITLGVPLYYNPTGNHPDYVNYYRYLVGYKDSFDNTYNYGFLTSISQHVITRYPENNRYSFEVSGRASNVERVRLVAKDGAALNADGYWRAQYPATCSNNITCNKPSGVQGANGALTEYTYASNHGGVETELFPADASGQRKRVSYTYESKDTGNGLLYRLKETEICFWNALQGCTGVKKRTTYAYWANTFLPETVTESADDVPTGTTTTYAYDDAGRVVQVTDARGGKTFRRYDIVGRLIGEISPSTGQARRLAKRLAYNPDDQVLTEDSGTVPDGQDGNAALWDLFMLLTRVTNSYDPRTGDKIQSAISTTAEDVTGVTQYSYDVVGRLECTAISMNPAVYGSLPASACVLGTAGTQGPDRITQERLRCGRPAPEGAEGLGVTTANGFPATLQQDYATYTYSPNGKQTSVIDANGNKATMTYDGFDRQVRWDFPSKTTGGTVPDRDDNHGEWCHRPSEARGPTTTTRNTLMTRTATGPS